MPLSSIAERVQALRDELAKAGLDGMFVPHDDEYQNEYIPESAERLAWITGFTGSAGYALILDDKAAVFTDGRYTLQIAQEVPQPLFDTRNSVDVPWSQWLAEHAPAGTLAGKKIGYDPWLHTAEWVERTAAKLRETGIELVPLAQNPIDALWTQGRPPAPMTQVEAHDIRHAGKSSADKRRELGEGLAKKTCAATVISDPSSIAWLLNVRGADVAFTPLPLSYAVLREDGTCDWYVDPAKKPDQLAGHLGNAVRIKKPGEFLADLDALKGKRVLVDRGRLPAAIANSLANAGAELVAGEDPCILPRAIKTGAEIAGAREAHKRDGVALAKFLAWFDGESATGKLTEMDVAAKLLAFRQQAGEFRTQSFETIPGSGPNGAIVHYRATPQSNRTLDENSLFLLDSGAQYRDGTTDVTRTLAVGIPTAEMRDRFTRVLKGHIAIATARFPKGTSGMQLDALARHALWQSGLDYDHGTGHGVGSYLGVHEGPHGISKAVRSAVPLQPGMIVSNEPGYYKTGQYGIRIEALVAVHEKREAGDEREMLGFETLTLAPIDRRLIDSKLMSDIELDWLNAYHARVKTELTPHLDAETARWLAAATAPMARP